MPDLLHPPTQTQPWTSNPRYANLRPFNSQTASEAARKRHERDRLRALAPPPLPEPSNPNDSQSDRLALLDEQIARTREALNTGKLEPHHRAALLRAICDLLDQQRIARGEPLPGSLRPSSRGGREDRRQPGGGLLGVAAPAPQPAFNPPTTPAQPSANPETGVIRGETGNVVKQNAVSAGFSSVSAGSAGHSVADQEHQEHQEHQDGSGI